MWSFVKALKRFIVEEEPKPKTAASNLQPSPNQPASQTGPREAAPAKSGPAVVSVKANAVADFSALYKSLGIATLPFTAEQILQMRDELLRLGTSPENVPRDLSAHLKIEAKMPPDQLAGNVWQRISALDQCASGAFKEQEEFTRRIQSEIDNLKAEIAAKEASKQEHTFKQRRIVDSCQTESARWKEVFRLLGFDGGAKKAMQGD
jgi:hypothetical protein